MQAISKYSSFILGMAVIIDINFKATGSNCANKWLVDRPFCPEADDIFLLYNEYHDRLSIELYHIYIQ